MIKRAYAVQMSYDITDEEKQMAEKSLLVLNANKNSLKKASEYLNILFNILSKNPSIDPEQVFKFRRVLRKFRDETIEKFNEFKQISFKAIYCLNFFSTDTQTIKLIKSYTNSIEELELKVNRFVDLFDNLKDKDFVANVNKEIEVIQKKCEELETLIDDRVKSHIKNNILSKSWVDNVSNDLQLKIERRTPLIVELYNQRKKELEKSFNNGEEHAG